MQKVLVVEDDDAIREAVVDALRQAGYGVLEARDGDDGLRAALQAEYDILLLDLLLPGTDGLQILRQLKHARPTQPVIILTALGEEAQRVEGLRLGADDYVVKPFSIKELLARIEAVLRRSPERPLDVSEIAIEGGLVDLSRQEVRFRDGERVTLTEAEVRLLRYLAANQHRAVSRDELLLRLWGLEPSSVRTRAIDMQITRLRKKLRDDPTTPRIILTVRGKGYMLAAKGD